MPLRQDQCQALPELLTRHPTGHHVRTKFETSFRPSNQAAPGTRWPAQDFIAGETLHALANRHDISRNLIRIWVRKFEAGAFDDDAQAADLLQDYEAKIAALERMVGRQALEIEFLKGALKNAPRPRSASRSVITGPVVSPSPKDAG